MLEALTLVTNGYVRVRGFPAMATLCTHQDIEM